MDKWMSNTNYALHYSGGDAGGYLLMDPVVVYVYIAETAGLLLNSVMIIF